MTLPSVLDEIDRLFDELVHRPWGIARRLMPAELREVDDGWVVELPVEGLRVEDLRLEVLGRQLMVSGHRRHERGEHTGQMGWFRTLQESSIQHSITLPEGADPDRIEAKKEGSTLHIHIGRRRQP